MIHLALTIAAATFLLLLGAAVLGGICENVDVRLPSLPSRATIAQWALHAAAFAAVFAIIAIVSN